MDEIVGEWSADALFAPGTSDEMIYFLERNCAVSFITNS